MWTKTYRELEDQDLQRAGGPRPAESWSKSMEKTEPRGPVRVETATLHQFTGGQGERVLVNNIKIHCQSEVRKIYQNGTLLDFFLWNMLIIQERTGGSSGSICFIIHICPSICVSDWSVTEGWRPPLCAGVTCEQLLMIGFQMSLCK